jgi:hypothetical protein
MTVKCFIVKSKKKKMFIYLFIYCMINGEKPFIKYKITTNYTTANLYIYMIIILNFHKILYNILLTKKIIIIIIMLKLQ